FFAFHLSFLVGPSHGLYIINSPFFLETSIKVLNLKLLVNAEDSFCLFLQQDSDSKNVTINKLFL
ncbi:hypothetical protein LVK10_14375, partial [Tenacibaculum maritimum]|uniref:hypothetical protein n=1 Tax=Tenacibaculum maritimum TaxID=107401 RepID=UPI001E5F6F72